MASTRKRRAFRLSFTTPNCMVGGVPYQDIPLLIGPKNQIIEVASDWFRHLIMVRGKAPSSIRQFSYHIKHWLEYLNRSKIAWDEVDDSTMMIWRDKHLKGIDPKTVNGYMSTVFRMYLWAEKNGYVKGLIGEPDLANNIHPGLSVEVTFDRRGTRKLVSPLLRRTAAKPVLPIPTNEEITKVHEALAEQYGGNLEVMVRDALILTWAELSGTRRMEVLSLKRRQIPAWNDILELEETGEKAEITITGKGGKKRSLWVGADLLTQTREYMEQERQVLFLRLRKSRGSNYRNPDEIFLSSKTGRRLGEDSVSQKFAIAFRKAGVRGSIHRVRARFLTNLIEYAIERELEALGTIPDATSVLLPVAQLAGHSHVETLGSYFAIGKKRLLRQTLAERTAVAEERAIGAQRRSDTNQLRLKYSTVALNLVRLLSSGNKKKIRNALRELCEAQGIDFSELEPDAAAHEVKKQAIAE